MWQEVAKVLAREVALESAPAHGQALAVEVDVVAWAALVVEAGMVMVVAAVVEQPAEPTQGLAQAWELIQSQSKP